MDVKPSQSLQSLLKTFPRWLNQNLQDRVHEAIFLADNPDNSHEQDKLENTGRERTVPRELENLPAKARLKDLGKTKYLRQGFFLVLILWKFPLITGLVFWTETKRE